MNLRRLNPDGIVRFTDYLLALKTDQKLSIPTDLLTDTAASEEIPPGIEIKETTFGTRLDAAAYIDKLLSATDLPNPERDTGIWAWLALYYFDQLCPPASDGARKVGEIARYIPQIDVSRRYYRHMLLGPVVMFRAHADNPKRLLALLSNPMNVATSETYRLFIENPSLIACNAVVETATLLYYDHKRMKLKRGAGSKDAGGCRRLIDYLQQIDCTYDLPSLTMARLGAMLPDEFQRFFPK